MSAGETVAHGNDRVGAAEAARRARRASRMLAVLSNKQRNDALLLAADRLEESEGQIVAANAEDLRAAELPMRAGSMSQAMLSRLRVSEKSVADMAEKVRSVAGLPDPLRRKLNETELDRGLVLAKETCPLGVVAVVFESRPDVLPQVASLALKSGNAILLKGGREAAHTNEVLIGVWNQALRESRIPADAAHLLHSRADVAELLELERDVDLLIPRGGREFVETISRQSRIPVLGHGEGICHVYVHAAADCSQAERIVLDAKLDYPAACNAAETLLVDAAIAPGFLPDMVGKLRAAGVEVRGCERTGAIVPSGVDAASERDWSTEYGDLILSVKVVDGLDEAIAHIHQYGSGHTEAIVTDDPLAAERFLNEVDAAGVYHNASTRFADGYRYGLGAEVGISNGKLHARGPMGLEGLTTYKYKLRGSGQTVGDYKSGRKFTHRRL
ncbi:MAG TPA: glutamate-5-semialdehyde dehydrogenase [Candidatus Acidoferrum sp.]|nr:glutamate-5-semialdehyde dehydrogenase [Candidatus Acidoferrum sp.]